MSKETKKKDNLKVPSNEFPEDTFLDIHEKFHELANSISPDLNAIESTLGIPEGFIKSLLDEENDWSFIIKLAVIVESALGQVINTSLKSESLDRHIRKLPIDGRTGKIQLALDLEIIGPKSAARMRSLAKIRNDFAHDLGIIHLSLKEYFSRLTPKEAAKLISTLTARDGTESESTLDDKEGIKDIGEITPSLARSLVWACGSSTLLELSRVNSHLSKDTIINEILVLTGKAFVERTQGNISGAEEFLSQARLLLSKVA